MSEVSPEEKILLECLAEGAKFNSASEFHDSQLAGCEFWVFPDTMTENEKYDWLAARKRIVAEEMGRLQRIYFDKDAA